MDPNLFHIDWERVSEVLATIVVLSFLVERALAIVFESKWYLKHAGDWFPKELVAWAVSALVCLIWKFDAFSMIVLTDQTTPLGEILTGAVIAGGSKASLKLFHDVLGVRSSAHETAYPPDPHTGKPSPVMDKVAVQTL